MIIGFVGVGNMGSALAENVRDRGYEVHAFDAAGPGRLPDGVRHAPSIADLARTVDVAVFSLPDGRASAAVAGELAAVADRRLAHVVDTSTIGVKAAVEVAAALTNAGIGYVDAPVSGGVAGASARTLAVLYAGDVQACADVEPVIAALSDRRFHVGKQPGMAQGLKVLNNFLAATALAATSEAVAFGTALGLDMTTMLDALNASSGRNSATADKFPNHVLTGIYASGFANTLMAKDVGLYRDAVVSLGTSDTIGQITNAIWQRFAEVEPAVDFTRIYTFVERRRG